MMRRTHAPTIQTTDVPRLKVITFDLDNTLWDVDRVIIRAERKMRSWLSKHVPEYDSLFPPEKLLDLRNQVVQANPEMRHDLSKLREELLYQAIQSCGYAAPESRSFAADAFALFFEARHDVEFFDGALEILATLQEHYVLGALTNGNADFAKLKLDEYFSFGFSSATVGAAKPAPEIFQAALRHVNARPEQCVHVGDHLVDDVEGAANVGMHTIWVNLQDSEQREPNTTPSETVSSLMDIAHAVERIQGER
jgi:HAD superfamily hydrolase (TIGR01549 family)